MDAQNKTAPIYFNPQKVGSQMREIGVDFLRLESSDDIETRWFREPLTETDVFIWFNKNKKIIKQQVSIMGLLIEWNIVEGVRTGMVMESEILQEQPASEHIHFDQNIQPNTIETAISVIYGMTCIQKQLQQKLIQNFSQVQVPVLQGEWWLRLNILRWITSCFRK